MNGVRVVTGMKEIHTAIIERLDCRASQIVRVYNLFEARRFASFGTVQWPTTGADR